VKQSRWDYQTLTQEKTSRPLLGICLAILLLCPLLYAADTRPAAKCQPTEADALGPFYKPDAPQRSKVGEGYVLQGVVRSAATCQPLANAIVEFWLAGADGRYSDAYRARVLSEETGRYTFESHRPPPYSGRPAHIHLRVTAPGHRPLVTQHYPTADQQQATFDLVLVPQ
jgi:protocatechuate 3,4-dioxygenase beta subunit